MWIVRVIVVTLALAAVVGFSPAAQADINVATEQPVAGDRLDIALIDTATGDHLSLPPGINTSAEEIHPSITPDGKPREELFLPDRLHFNEQGYKLLADRVRPFLPPPSP